MSLEQAIIDLTSRTPSGGTCWIGDVPFTVWYCSDYWEWVFRGVYYFDPQDLSEAIEAFVQQTAEGSRQAIPLAETSAEKGKAGPGLARRKAHLVGTKGRPLGLLPKARPRPAVFPATR
jgi:hypothetical protein